MTIAFTGHRPQKLGGFIIPNPTYNHICSEIRAALIKFEPTEVISGMALGVDQWAAEIALDLGIPLCAALPFVGQEAVWPQVSQDHWRKLFLKATRTVVVSPGAYSARKMQKRDEWMVDNCDKLIAVWDGSQSGTGNCVHYAKGKDVDIFYIKP